MKLNNKIKSMNKVSNNKNKLNKLNYLHNN